MRAGVGKRRLHSPRRQSRSCEPGAIAPVIQFDALLCALWAPMEEHTGGYLYLWGRADSNEILESSGVWGGPGLPELGIDGCACVN